MDFHAAMETFAEAWVAANMQNCANTGEMQVFRNHNSSEMSTINEEAVREGWMSSTSSKSTKHPTTRQPSTTHHAHQSASSYSSTGFLSSIGAVRSIPIHCIVEQGNQNGDDQPPNIPDYPAVVIRDAFAILPGSMLFNDILRGALTKIGFSASEAIGAKGTIQIRNWKPLPFEYITDNPNSTVEDILSDVISTATLRIRLSRVDLDKIEWNDQAVRYAIVKLLKEVNQITLAKICPLPQSMISNIANSKYTAKICLDKCREFGEWYKEYRKEHKGLEASVVTGIKEGENKSGYSPNSRLTFHPIYELPMMREWYKSCPNPANDDLKRFLDELNSTPVRQERVKVPLRRLKIWWRNEKQRLKRIQTKEQEKLASSSGKEEDDNLGARVTADIIEPMLVGGEDDNDCDCSSVSEPGGVMELTQKRNRESKNGRMSTQSDYSSMDQQSFGAPVHNNPGPPCFHTNSGKTFSSEMNPSLPSASQHPVYVNSPSEVGFHVRYLNDHPSHGGQNDIGVPNSSPRCHLPLAGLHVQPPNMSPINPHVYHINDSLYSPAFHPCSAANATHGGSGSG